MASCAPPALKAKLQLEDGDNGRREWRYVKPAAAQLARGFEAMWREASESLATMLGCDAEDEQVVRHWRLVAATLHLGQIDFKKNEQKNSDQRQPRHARRRPRLVVLCIELCICICICIYL